MRSTDDGLRLECADREVAPEWVRAHVPAEWVERYGERLEHERLRDAEEEERKQYANQVGADGWVLLHALKAASTADWMKTLPAITTLRCMWEQQFEPLEQGGKLREEFALPAAQVINSPYDLDARYGKKRSTLWIGYKVHFTQTCDDEAPQLITHIETTRAGIPDEKALSSIHTSLAERGLLPDQHLVDAGYVDATNLIESQAGYEVNLVGPTLKNYWYQADTGYDLTHFSIDWQAQTVTCPQGHASSSWTPSQDAKGKPVIRVKFAPSGLSSVFQSSLLYKLDAAYRDLAATRADAGTSHCTKPREHTGIQRHLSPSSWH